MDAPHVSIRYARDLPHDADAAYAWLTDYQDTDPELAGHVLVAGRRVVRRGPDEIELDADLVTLGRRTQGPATVRLYPAERRWVATAARGRFVFTYRLTPTPGGCRLDVDYRVAARRWRRRMLVRLARPWLRRDLARMWDNFAAAMARDLARTPARAPA